MVTADIIGISMSERTIEIVNYRRHLVATTTIINIINMVATKTTAITVFATAIIINTVLSHVSARSILRTDF